MQTVMLETSSLGNINSISPPDLAIHSDDHCTSDPRRPHGRRDELTKLTQSRLG